MANIFGEVKKLFENNALASDFIDYSDLSNEALATQYDKTEDPKLKKSLEWEMKARGMWSNEYELGESFTQQGFTVGARVKGDGFLGTIEDVDVGSFGNAGDIFLKVRWDDGELTDEDPYTVSLVENKKGIKLVETKINGQVLVYTFSTQKQADAYKEKLEELGYKTKVSPKTDLLGDLLYHVEVIRESKLNEQDEPAEEPIAEEVPGSEPSNEPEKEKNEPEKEKTEEPAKTKDVPASGEEKEFLGAKGQDQFFYTKQIYSKTGEVEDILLVDASEKQITSAKELNIDPKDMINFILEAVKKGELTLVSVDILTKYLTKPKEEEEKEENEEVKQDLENQTVEEEPAITSPEPEEVVPEINTSELSKV